MSPQRRNAFHASSRRQSVDEQRQTVRAGYDAMAETYDDERSASATANEGLQTLREVLPERPRVLDLGCGAGRGH